jgi:methylenetetrahydrofolate dehydrogenase (NADP+)/methenyltetrahydrofolate cyclohydrolase
MATILDGRAVSARILAKLKARVTALPEVPRLAVILVGDDAASHLYVNLKEQACKEVGVAFERFEYPASISTEALVEKVRELNTRKDVTGILVQVPLPEGIDTDSVTKAIAPHKDVDGFHPENLSKLAKGEPSLVPPVALGIVKLIDEAHTPLRGRWAAIISSELFAKPIEALLKDLDVKAFVVDPADSDIAGKTKTADVLITAVGKPGLIKADAVKPGAVVIDVGTTRVENKTLGDVDRTSVESVAGFLTPVPGGVGPMTVAMLLSNVVKAAVTKISNSK